MSIISSPLPSRPYRRIATEEAFSPPEMLEIYKRILKQGDVDQDLYVQRDE
jgi:2,3-dihydroxybenzoate decarboxylase